MNILGISAYYHDSAACLVRDGVVVAAAQEERFTRKKHDASFPHHAIRYCLESQGVAEDGLTLWCFTTSRSTSSFVSSRPISRLHLSVLNVSDEHAQMGAKNLWIGLEIAEVLGDLGYLFQNLFYLPNTTNRTRPARFFLRPFRMRRS